MKAKISSDNKNFLKHKLLISQIKNKSRQMFYVFKLMETIQLECTYQLVYAKVNF